jgi:hypothetical protein
MPLYKFLPVLSEVQAGRAWEPSNEVMIFRKVREDFQFPMR